jgi:hypothetical protein
VVGDAVPGSKYKLYEVANGELDQSINVVGVAHVVAALAGAFNVEHDGSGAETDIVKVDPIEPAPLPEL